MGLRDILDAATPGPWAFDPAEPCLVGGDPQGSEGEWGQEVAETRDEQDARLIALAPELAALCLDMGEWMRDFLMGDNIDPGDRADLETLLARLDRLGKKPSDG